MKLLMTWSLPSSCNQTAGTRLLVTFVWQGLCSSKAKFFHFWKRLVSKVLKNIRDSHMWTMQRSSAQSRWMESWCFKALRFLSGAWPISLCSILPRSRRVGISFCRNCNRLTIHMQDVLPFPFLNYWRSKGQFRHKVAFCQGAGFNRIALLDYGSSSEASLYATQLNTGRYLLSFKFSKQFQPAEENAKWQAVIERMLGKHCKTRSKSLTFKARLFYLMAVVVSRLQ